VNLDDPQDRSVAAGEFVMGTLEAADRAAFEAALARDSGLQAEVYAWQDRLLGLTRRVAPIEPDASAWSRIEARLAHVPVAASTASAAPAVPSLPVAAPAPARVGRPEPAANDARVRFWRAVSGLAVAACLVLGTLLVLRAPAPDRAERYLTLLQAPDKSTGWVVEVTAGQRLRLVPLAPAGVLPPGKALQFWTKIDGAAGPTSLGLVRPGEVTEVPLDRLPGLVERQLFELTLEPETGSPIGRPTGPILFVGRSVRI
jgi:anti-sigma-K factor RskA